MYAISGPLPRFRPSFFPTTSESGEEGYYVNETFRDLGTVWKTEAGWKAVTSIHADDSLRIVCVKPTRREAAFELFRLYVDGDDSGDKGDVAEAVPPVAKPASFDSSYAYALVACCFCGEACEMPATATRVFNLCSHCQSLPVSGV